MDTITLNTKEAKTKWWAYRDAERRSSNNASHHTDSTKVRAERMKMVLENLYSSKSTYIAYGRRSVSLKLHSPIVKHRGDLRFMEEEWSANGVVKKVSDHGIIYSFTPSQ